MSKDHSSTRHAQFDRDLMAIHDHIRGHALESPDSVALVFGSARISYAELDAAAETFADDLTRRGVNRGDHVPVLLPRSPSLVVALLAVLKLGASYAAFDPRWPEGRVRSLLEQLRCALLVSERTDFALPNIVPSDESSSVPRTGPRSRQLVDSGAAATIFFTSGTSGTPKAILSPHRATTRLFASHALDGFSRETVIVQSAPLPWDGLTLELWGALIVGGTVVLCSEDVLLPSGLRAAIQEHGVTTLWQTSSLFNLFMDEDPGAFEGITSLYIGGERLSPAHVRKCLERHPGMTVYNGYGPAESCVFATVHKITVDDLNGDDGIPIGSPVHDTFVHLFDETGAVSDQGEIYIEGTGLAIEYLNDPLATSSAFAFVEIRGVQTRVYRTGDLGHWNKEGNLVFDGRADRQVKIRGHRIELAELEAAAVKFAGVSRCVADLSGPDREVISLYVVASSAGDTDAVPRSVLSALEGMLPAYLMPRHVISVETLPLTANGKTDLRRLRQLLPKQRASYAVAEQHMIVQPHEENLLRVVTSVLSETVNHQRMDPTRAFFEQGGDSLSAVRAIARLRKVGLHFTPSRFTRETSAIDIVRGASKIEIQDCRMVNESAANTDNLVPLTDAQAMVCLQQTLDPDDASFACLMNWTGSGAVDPDALRAALADVIARHQPLRARYSIENGAFAEVLPSGPELILSTTMASSAAEAREYVGNETSFGFDIGEGRLVKAALAFWQANRFTLGVGVHHVAFDGWSESVFARDLTHAYASRTAGVAGASYLNWNPYPPAPTMWEIQVAHERQIDYASLPLQRQRWIEDLSDAPADLYPPPDPGMDLRALRAVPDIRTFTVAHSQVIALKTIARDSAVTLLSILLRDFHTAVGRVLAIEDIVVGIPLARRGDPHLAHAISYLVDMLPVRLRAAHSQSATEIQRAVDAAKSAQDISFAQITGLLKRPRNEPIFRTIFALQNNQTPSLVLNGRETVFTRPPANRPLADLVVEISEEGDDGLTVQVTYRQDVVKKSVVERIVADYSLLLNQSENQVN